MNKRFTKIFALVATAILLSVTSLGAASKGGVKVIKPTSKVGNSFAIIIDNTTFEKDAEQVYAYRDALQDDGLRTYIISSQWNTPDEVRDQLIALNKKAKNLEGIILIGDIPVVMVRNAQHMTTAFKMDEEGYPRTESSVGSDRFYDDLHLQFEYIDRDTTDSGFFYYKLKEDSPQRVAPTFYSGRVKCPTELGVDKYEAIAGFLTKAVEAHRNPSELDNIVTYAGSGYNSDCLITWMDGLKTVRENFPNVVDDAMHLKRLNFRMDKFMKYRLFDELSRPEVDAFFFNEHGSIDKQHISDMPENETMDDWYESYKLGMVYPAVSREIKSSGRDSLEVIEEAKAQFHLTDRFFEDFAEYPALREANRAANDSLYGETIISLEDLTKIAPQPRFVMFNACYNGSFHRPGSIGSYYIFGDGQTVATQGNTVNVLQDKWTYEAIGLLSTGCRIGEYNRMVATLEGHIIGDPTFHYKADPQCDFRGQICANYDNIGFWKGLVDSPFAGVQTVAVRRLAELGALSASQVLDKMRTASFGTVRMECLKLLTLMHDNDALVEGIKLGLNDDYEVVRRRSSTLVGKCGDPRLYGDLMRLALTRPEQIRVADYSVITSARMLDIPRLEQEARALTPTLTWLDSQARVDELIERLEYEREVAEHNFKTATDRSLAFKPRKMALRSIRNTNMHEHVPEFLAIVADNTEDPQIRQIMTEALGWFTESYRRQEIIDGLSAVLTSDSELPEELRAELVQTLNRLK